ncbi:MAG TPA: right-handed parallel beta-helix repeat-containing protein, partial [Phycisphaerales bacterium]|nr:right-handed parallel beta-helix repeat-containing protein [Phycisphaerales bacterium]
MKITKKPQRGGRTFSQITTGERGTAVIAAGVMLLLAGQVHATDRLVPSQYSTIQAAATAAVSGDQVIVSPGTYHETITMFSKSVNIISTGGSGVTIIDGTGLGAQGMLVGFPPAPGLTIQGFTIQNCAPASGSGAGIEIFNGTYSVSDLVVKNNTEPTGSAGGGMYVSSATGTISNCSFINNTAVSPSSGGGMYVATGCNVTISNCLFSGNHADTGAGAMTFAASTTSATFDTCTFQNNTAAFTGGGSYSGGPSATVLYTNCTYDGNHAPYGAGAGVFNGFSNTFSHCHFMNNV